MIPERLQVSRRARARRALGHALAVTCLAGLLAPEAWASRILDVRVGEHEDHARIVIELDRAAGYRVEHDAARGVFTVTLEASADAETLASPSGAIESVVVEPVPEGARARVRLRDRKAEIRERILSDPPRIVLDFHPARPQEAAVPRASSPPAPVAKSPKPAPPPPREAQPVPAEPVAQAEPVPPVAEAVPAPLAAEETAEAATEALPEASAEAGDAEEEAAAAEAENSDAAEAEALAPLPEPEEQAEAPAPAPVSPVEIARPKEGGDWNAALAVILSGAGVVLILLALRHRRARRARPVFAKSPERGAAPRTAPEGLGDAEGAGAEGEERIRERIRRLREDDDAAGDAQAGTTMTSMTRER